MALWIIKTGIYGHMCVSEVLEAPWFLSHFSFYKTTEKFPRCTLLDVEIVAGGDELSPETSCVKTNTTLLRSDSDKENKAWQFFPTVCCRAMVCFQHFYLLFTRRMGESLLQVAQSSCGGSDLGNVQSQIGWSNQF